MQLLMSRWQIQIYMSYKSAYKVQLFSMQRGCYDKVTLLDFCFVFVCIPIVHHSQIPSFAFLPNTSLSLWISPGLLALCMFISLLWLSLLLLSLYSSLRSVQIVCPMWIYITRGYSFPHFPLSSSLLLSFYPHLSTPPPACRYETGGITLKLNWRQQIVIVFLKYCFTLWLPMNTNRNVQVNNFT